MKKHYKKHNLYLLNGTLQERRRMQQPLPVGFLVDADKEDGADLEREEASEGGVVGVLDALRV